MESAKLNEIDPRARRTRKLLMQAFKMLQQRKSISSISVQDIAEEADVNRATFYAHFQDKYDFLDSWVREEFQQVLASKLPARSTLSMSNLRVLIESVFDFLGDFNSHCKPSDRQLEPMLETAMQQELYKLLLSWLEQTPSATSRPHEELEGTALVISWAIFGPAAQWSRGERTQPVEEMSDHVMAVVSGAVVSVLGPVAD
jgi:AcrR family transcriptional regulator